MPDNHSVTDFFRPGLDTLTVFEDLGSSRLHPAKLQFAADFAGTSDRSTFSPWLKTPVALTPGEPVKVKWEFEAGVSPIGDQVVVRIDYEGTVIYTSAPVVLKKGKSGLQRATLFIDGAMADQFYRLGFRTLTLSLTGNGDAPGPLKRRTYWNVVSPIGIQSFWAWDGPSERHENWKSDFNLAGRFINATPFTAMQTTHIRLEEDDANWHDAVESTNVICDQWDAPGVVKPAVEVPHNFRVEGKRFFWMHGKDGGYIKIAGPHFRYYHYRVFIKLSDIYGNDYAEFADVNPFSELFDGVRVQVEVSKSKELWADIASVSFASSVALSKGAAVAGASGIGALFAVGLGLGAAALATTSYIYGEKALDPPSPDPDFFARVEVIRPNLPQGAGDEVQPIIDWLEAACTIVAVDDALVAIEGKILGAKEAQAQPAIDQQLQRYGEVRQEAVSEFDRLIRLQDSAERALNGVQQQLNQVSSQIPSPRIQLTDEVRVAFQRQQIPPEMIEAIESRLANFGEFMAQSDLVGLPLFTGRVLTMLMRYMLRYDPMTQSLS